jgi:flagellar hook-associated protein 3 FlgL
MRITYGMSAATSLTNIERNQQRMADLEAQLTSGSKFTKPSDDPIGVARALGFQQSIDQSTQFLKNIDQGTSWLNTTDSTLGAVNNDVQRARELAVQAANGTMTAQDKIAIQSEVAQLQHSVLDLANTKLGASYLFSGTKSDKPGYLLAVSSAINPTAYQGNAAVVQREVTPGVSVGVNADAQATFDPVFKALASLQAGLSSPSSAPAVSTAGVVMGSGPLQTVGTGGRLTLNGVAVTMTAGDTPAQTVANINGTAGLQGAGGVTASLSTDPATFGNLVLTANTAGSSGAVSIGAATGVGNTIYANLGVSAGSSSGVDNPAAIQAQMQQSLTDLDAAIDAINVSRSGVGAKMNRLETLQGQQQGVNLNLSGLLSQVKDVDMAQAITAFTMAQTVYQASLKSAAQALQPSLLDFLK